MRQPYGAGRCAASFAAREGSQLIASSSAFVADLKTFARRPSPMGKLSKSELVRKLALKSFKECDLDKDGQIDVKELHVGLLLVYDKLNKTLPVYLQPPEHGTVQALLRKYDGDASGHLNFEEFHDCVRMLVGTNDTAKLTDSLPFKIVSRMLLKMVLFPVAAWAIKTALEEVGGEGTKEVVRKVPNAVLVFAVEGAYKAGKLALQER